MQIDRIADMKTLKPRSRVCLRSPEHRARIQRGLEEGKIVQIVRSNMSCLLRWLKQTLGAAPRSVRGENVQKSLACCQWVH